MWKKITSIKLIEKIKNLSKKKKILFSVGFLIFLVLIISIVIYSKQGSKVDEATAPFIEDQIIVKYKTDLSSDEKFLQKLKNLGIVSQEKVYKQTQSPILSRYYLLKLKKDTDVKNLINQLLELKEIEVAEPNYIYTTQVIPNDPDFQLLWGLNKIDMPNAWNLGTGKSQIKVAVVDTGVDGSHPELSGRVVDAVDCVSGNCVSSSATDNHYHGTHVAGTIGAAGNDSNGITGVNWNVSFIAVKVLDSNGRGTTTAIVSGIAYAADNGARVINLSLGGKSSCLAVQQDAINYALGKGSSVIVAAGNDQMDASYISPASCNGVVTVGATGSNDERAAYSNYGSVVDIAAPGGNSSGTKTAANTILSTSPGGAYRLLQGTSMATPHVVGVAALLLSINPGLSPSQVKSCLVDNADPISTDASIGPRLNALRTLNACSGLTPITTTTIVGGSTTTTTVPQTDYPYISGKAFVDSNNNNTLDPNEDGVAGVDITVNGPSYTNVYVTGSTGNFIFRKVPIGAYTVKAEFRGKVENYTFNIPDKNNGVILSVPIPPDLVNVPGSTTTTTSTLPPGSITTTTKSLYKTTTTTTIPKTFYDCVIDPTCLSNKDSMQFCPLICTPK